jgi:anaerobic C4-dicarboxylate transporter
LLAAFLSSVSRQYGFGTVMRETIDNEPEQWSSVLKAGLAYFVIVFGVGFLLGTFRVVAVIPVVGERAAVMLELPIMLAISWFSSLWLIAKFNVVCRLMPRLIMGGLAFGLLMAGEVGVSMFGLGRTLAEHLASYGNEPTILGLLAQLAFASFPAIQLAIRR